MLRRLFKFAFLVFSGHIVFHPQRYDDLVAYKEKHGHINVPQAEKPLGGWLHSQRKDYSAFVRGKRKTYEQWKIDKLNELGIVWLMRKNRPSASDKAKKAAAAKKAKKAAEPEQSSSSSDDEDEEQNSDNGDNNHFQPVAQQRLLNPWERYQLGHGEGEWT
jgi:hypothetical protein